MYRRLPGSSKPLCFARIIHLLFKRTALRVFTPPNFLYGKSDSEPCLNLTLSTSEALSTPEWRHVLQSRKSWQAFYAGKKAEFTGQTSLPSFQFLVTLPLSHANACTRPVDVCIEKAVTLTAKRDATCAQKCLRATEGDCSLCASALAARLYRKT